MGVSSSLMCCWWPESAVEVSEVEGFPGSSRRTSGRPSAWASSGGAAVSPALSLGLDKEWESRMSGRLCCCICASA